MLPHVIRFNAHSAAPLYAELAAIFVPRAKGSETERAAALVDHLAELPLSLELQTRLSQVGISREDLAHLAQDAMKQTRLLINNPREIGYDDALAIYSAAL